MKFVVIAQLQQKNTHLMYSHIARFVSESVRFDSMSCQISCTVTRCAAFLSWFFNYYLSSLLHTWHLCLCFAIVFSLSTQQKPLVSFQMRSCVYSTVNIFALFFHLSSSSSSSFSNNFLVSLFSTQSLTLYHSLTNNYNKNCIRFFHHY